MVTMRRGMFRVLLVLSLVAIPIALIASPARALPIFELNLGSAEHDAVLTVEVSEVEVDGVNLWRYDYALENLGPGSITSMTLGFGSSVLDQDLGDVAPYAYQEVGFTYQSPDSLMYFLYNPSLEAGSVLNVYVLYDTYVMRQDVNVAGSASTGGTLFMPSPNNTPEPGTLLLVGTALVGLGLICRRKFNL